MENLVCTTWIHRARFLSTHVVWEYHILKLKKKEEKILYPETISNALQEHFHKVASTCSIAQKIAIPRWNHSQNYTLKVKKVTCERVSGGTTEGGHLAQGASDNRTIWIYINLQEMEFLRKEQDLRKRTGRYGK